MCEPLPATLWVIPRMSLELMDSAAAVLADWVMPVRALLFAAE